MNVFWRYRIENYRVLAKIEDDKAVVLAVEVGHRKDVYKVEVPAINERSDRKSIFGSAIYLFEQSSQIAPRKRSSQKSIIYLTCTPFSRAAVK